MSADQQYEEKVLLSLIAKGDEAAFTKLYSYYQPRLLRYVSPFALGKEQAEEIVQEVLFRLWTRKETFVGVASLEGYLRRSARNLLLDIFRRQALEKKYMEQQGAVQHTQVSADDNLQLKEYHELAKQAIALLPQKQREVFILRHQQDMTLEEIAVYTNSSYDAVRKNLHRAVQFIKSFLKDHGEWVVCLVLLLLAECP
ncbi:RNA polymerase sigma factor [Chitinophaga rhizophila]|uniref:Sigma-70 family RNA polymerase sigma factor n=1 Tax=Chitinophaga rhizophila TaxID=2866212 RepID=A0ABS7G9F6_9BACT|nr:sigma-70 family RNA polymerase sigma factor [Chitinophaga rhizophila]MBW8683765.1 sigma-70 family RNA polymerase sigma factor [Chitinophaga rhizophila]